MLWTPRQQLLRHAVLHRRPGPRVFNFLDSGLHVPGVDVVRVTGKWDYIDASGVLGEVLPMTWPFTYGRDGTGMGRPIELSKTPKNNRSFPGANATDDITATDLTVTKVADDTHAYANISGHDTVWRVVNSSGSEKYVIFDGATGDTDRHSARVEAKVAAGAPSMSLTGTSAPGDSTSLNTSGDWEENTLLDVLPGNADNQLQIVVPDGASVDLIGIDFEEGRGMTSYVPSDGAPGTRDADYLSMPYLDLLSLYKEMTCLMEFQFTEILSSQTITWFGSNDTSNRFTFALGGAKFLVQHRTSGAVTNLLMTPGTNVHRMAGGFRDGVTVRGKRDGLATDYASSIAGKNPMPVWSVPARLGGIVASNPDARRVFVRRMELHPYLMTHRQMDAWVNG